MFNFVYIYIYARAKRVLEPVTRNSQIQLHNDIIIIYVYTALCNRVSDARGLFIYKYTFLNPNFPRQTFNGTLNTG